MESLKFQAYLMIYFGVGAWVFSAFQISFYYMFAGRLAYHVRINYFRACLEKDGTYYDMHNPNEMTAKISKEVGAIQRGNGDKIGLTVVSLVCFFSGFIVAFIWGWKLSLVLTASLPIMGVLGAVWGAAFEQGKTQEMRVYAQSAGYAEQALQAIKVVHTYGNEKTEEASYTKFLNKSYEFQASNAFKNAAGNATIMAFFNLFYGYTLFFGGYFIMN